MDKLLQKKIFSFYFSLVILVLKISSEDSFWLKNPQKTRYQTQNKEQLQYADIKKISILSSLISQKES